MLNIPSVRRVPPMPVMIITMPKVILSIGISPVLRLFTNVRLEFSFLFLFGEDREISPTGQRCLQALPNRVSPLQMPQGT